MCSVHFFAVNTMVLYMYVLIDDHNRVKLKFIAGQEGSDYINASFIDVSFHHFVLDLCMYH